MAVRFGFEFVVEHHERRTIGVTVIEETEQSVERVACRHRTS
jgi:hypothetical protein